MPSNLYSINGTKLNSSESAVTRHGFKGERQMIIVLKNPISIATLLGQTLLICYPTLKKDCVVMPGTVKLLYDVLLKRGTDLDAKFINNFGRAIIEKLSICMQGLEV